MRHVCTRFAPSPTGFMHVGGVRTALFAWLVARQSGGRFILRLEDTDKQREVEGSDSHIQDSLRWLGLGWDEGIGVSGPHAPYRQSERLDIYRQWAQRLIDQGRAYADPYTADEVNAFRDSAKAAKQPFLFRDFRPATPPEWDGSQPLRFRSDPKPYSWQDAVMGEMSAGAEAIDDFVLIKSDGYPTYNFAHIIDDHLMGCSHVIRSQEFIASVPRFLNLYEALAIRPPVLATVPFVMGPDGRKKLSKRDGAKDVLDYAREGYLPEALLNFMASLGWNDDSQQEIFSVDELISKFSLAKVQRSGARFDEQRLMWMNGAHIRTLPLDDLYARSRDFWPQSAAGYSDDYRKQVLALVQERLKYLGELPTLSEFFFVDLPNRPELIEQHKQLRNIEPPQLATWLDRAIPTLEQSDFTLPDLTDRLNRLLQDTDQKPAVLFSLIRIASTRSPASPGLAETLAVLGRDVSLRRLRETAKLLGDLA